MGLSSREILAEAREVLGNPNIHLRDFHEWADRELTPRAPDEVSVHLPKLGIWITVRARADKRPPLVKAAV